MKAAGKWIGSIKVLGIALLVSITTPLGIRAEIESGPAVLNQSIPDLENQSNTGATSLAIPIIVPPGRQGVEPDLQIIYSSFNSNGWVGVGWDLGLGAIQRSTKRGVDYTADNYVLMNGGTTSELVDRTSVWGAGYYGRKIESEFSKFYKNSQTGGWEVTARDGTRHFFGTSSSSRQTNTNGTFKWLLDRVEDTHGNYMSVGYSMDQGQLYLAEIHYTGNTNTSASKSKHLYFDLETRNDASISYKSKAEIKTAKRLSAIRVYSDDTSISWLVRTYKLDYEYDASAGFSRLKKVDLYGDDGTKLPPVTIDWHTAGSGAFASPFHANILFGSTSRSRDKAYIADINGDSRTDIIVSSWRHWDMGPDSLEVQIRFSNGDGTFSTVQNFPVMSNETLLNFADANGDGLSDVILFYLNSGLEQYQVYPSNGDGTFGAPIRTHLPKTVHKDSKAYIGDINGDGFSDIVFQRGVSLYERLSNGDGAFSKNDTTLITSAPNCIGLADVNGDGLADYLGYRNQYPYRYFYVHLSKGDGSFAPQILSDIPGAMHDEAIPTLGDVNGDGMVDVVFAYNMHTYFKISEGDGTFRAGSEPYGLAGGVGLHLSDVDGDGADDLIQVIMGSDESVSAYTSFNLDSGNPFLMTSFTDRAGARSTFTYSHSNDFSNTFLPFVVHALTSVSIDDGLGNISQSSFEYSGGLFDPAERSFRGYGRVKKTNPENVIVDTFFHQGEFDIGRPYKIELKEPAGSELLFSRTSLAWDDEPLSGAAFIKLTRKKTELFDSETVYAQEDYTYDSGTGLVTEMVSEGTDGPVARHQFDYQNLGGWIWRKTEETLLNGANEVVRRTLNSYESGSGNLRFVENDLDTGPSPVVGYEYDLYGNQTRFHDANGNPPQITVYDAATNTFPVQETNAVGHVTQYTWDYRYGRKASETDPNGNTTYFEYDPFGRLERIDYPDDGQELRVYADCEDAQCTQALVPRRVTSRVKEQISPDVYVDKFEYFDGLGRIVQTVTLGEDSQTIVSRQFYDEIGRVERSEGPFFSTAVGYPIATPSTSPYAETDYDYRSRPTKIETPLGRSSDQGTVAITKFSYSGFSTITIDPDGSQKTEKKDYLGRIIEVTEHTETEHIDTKYGYNVAGDMLSVTNHGSISTTIEYDTLGRKKNMDDPDTGYWRYSYDANGNLVSQVDAKSQTISFSHDAINRTVTKTYATSDPTVTYDYDDGSIQNGIGRLYKIENSNASTTCKAYDVMGRAKEVVRSIAGAPQSSYTTRYAYDLAGKLASIVYPDAYQVNYAYHPGSGLLDTVIGITDFTEYADIEDYQPTGKIGYIYHGNGTATTYSYDSESARILSIKTQDPGLTYIQNKSYKYSAAGDILKINDAAGSGSVSYSYTYDKLHRLLSENNTGGADNFKHAFLTKLYDENAPFHAPKKILSGGIEYALAYDLNGNMTTGFDFSDPGNIAKRTIAYNADNMPTKVVYAKTGATAAVDLYYDGEADRAKKVSHGGSTTFYIGEHFEVIGGVETKYVFAGNLRIAIATSAGKHFFHKDHLGSSSVITDGLSGSPVNSASYLPFGLIRKQTGSNSSGYKFTDQEIDLEIGLYNYDARQYDPAVGLFISADSMVPGEGFHPQLLNRYSYVGNSPLKFVDPSGHWFRDPGTGENVASDPSAYDVDYNSNYGEPGSFGGTHVDWKDVDDPGEAGWQFDKTSGDWINHNLDEGKQAAIVVTEVTIAIVPIAHIAKLRYLSRFKWWGKASKGISGTVDDCTLVIGKMKNLRKASGWKNGDAVLRLNKNTTVKENLKQLKYFMKKGKPIKDMDPTNNTGFLGNEHEYIMESGWNLIKKGDEYFWIKPK